MKNGNFLYAIATLVGTIVGVGIFGLPYAAGRAGFFISSLYLFGLFFVFALLHLMFGEIILRTNDGHRLLGYAQIYLGDRAKKSILFIAILGALGGMLIYILAGGEFLKIIFGDFLTDKWQGYLIFWAIMSAIFVVGLKAIKESETIMLIFMAAVVIFLFISGLPKIDVSNLFGFNPMNFFMPYGITMFALAGTVAIPAVRNILKGAERQMKRAIIIGTAVPLLFYFLFIVLVVGVSGSSVSEDAVSGLAGALGGPIIYLCAVFGILLVSTSYIVFGLYLRDTLICDLKVNKYLSVLFVLFIPIALVLLNLGSFAEIIGFLGGVFGGLESIYLVMIYKRAKKSGDRSPEYSLNIPSILLNLLIMVFAFGIFYTLFFDGRA